MQEYQLNLVFQHFVVLEDFGDNLKLHFVLLLFRNAVACSPSLVWEFYHHRRELVRTKQPNEAHIALAKAEKQFEKEGKPFNVITQNVDAGGNGSGDGLNQLNRTTYLFVDRQQNVYVPDKPNHRVMKWNKGTKESIVVAGGQDYGNALAQLTYSNELFVNTLGTLYVADQVNHHVMRWTLGDKKQGTLIVDGDRKGEGTNQFSNPIGLSFDRYGNLYVVDMSNHRVQRFSIETD
ncbi:unnamed protein product, partial [Rotaria socialis]